MPGIDIPYKQASRRDKDCGISNGNESSPAIERLIRVHPRRTLGTPYLTYKAHKPMGHPNIIGRPK